MISTYDFSNSSSFGPEYIQLNELENLSVPEAYDKVRQPYKGDYGQREPKFVGFAIQDDSIEIDMEIAVPFLSVPKKRGVGTRSRNFANINVAAIILAGFVAAAGTFFGGAARFFNGGSFFDGKPIFKRKVNSKERSRRDDHYGDSFFSRFMDNIDDSLKDIGFDSSACLARSICWHVKDSNMNVIEKRAEKIDIFIAGFSKSDWIHRAVTNDFLREAIESGGKGLNCEEKYKDCALNPSNVEQFSRKIQLVAKPKKVKRHQMR